jgi:hypothetical protein
MYSVENLIEMSIREKVDIRDCILLNLKMLEFKFRDEMALIMDVLKPEDYVALVPYARRISVLKFLLRGGVTIDAMRNHHDNSALRWIIEYGDTKMIKYLVKFKDVDGQRFTIQDLHEANFIGIAAEFCNISTLKYLLYFIDHNGMSMNIKHLRKELSGGIFTRLLESGRHRTIKVLIEYRDKNGGQLTREDVCVDKRLAEFYDC